MSSHSKTYNEVHAIVKRANIGGSTVDNYWHTLTLQLVRYFRSRPNEAFREKMAQEMGQVLLELKRERERAFGRLWIGFLVGAITGIILGAIW